MALLAWGVGLARPAELSSGVIVLSAFAAAALGGLAACQRTKPGMFGVRAQESSHRGCLPAGVVGRSEPADRTTAGPLLCCLVARPKAAVAGRRLEMEAS